MKTHVEDSVTIVRLSNRFDASNHDVFLRWLETGVTPDAAQVVVDLGDVTFVDSAALAALVKAARRCRQAGGDLRLCGLQKPVTIIFDLTRLDRAFSIYPDSQAAIRSFAS
jgi:anti-sigma B factor antagonist